VRKAQIFAVIERLSQKYSVSKMCDFYNVSRQGYYDYVKRHQAGNPDQPLIDMIIECQQANKNRLGYRRVKKWLKREKGIDINDKKVYRITSRNNLLSAIRRRKTLKYKPNGNLKYENVLNRKTHSDTPNTDWVTDISYIVMPDGTAYLSAIRDLCGQFIVAYKTSHRQDYSLVKNTIADAMQSEKPKTPPLLHSDGGGQYRSYDHKKIIEEYGLTPSMSKPATPGDNAMAENFFSIFKTECIYLEKPKTLDEALALTDEFLHYYNYERIQGNGLTPYEERQLAFDRQSL
jgi:transposase InsO family protein